MTKTYQIKGMNCSHCSAAVKNAISGVQGVESVEVNLSNGTATVLGSADENKIMEVVKLAGFDIQ